MVAAQAALIWSQQPYLKPAEVRKKIESSAIDLGSIGVDDTYGKGLVSFEGALRN
jgi:serine protease AprX